MIYAYVSLLRLGVINGQHLNGSRFLIKHLFRSNSNPLATITEVDTETETLIDEIQDKCNDLHITEEITPKDKENTETDITGVVDETETSKIVNESTAVGKKEATEEASDVEMVEEIDTSEYDRLIDKYPNIKYYNKQTDKELR